MLLEGLLHDVNREYKAPLRFPLQPLSTAQISRRVSLSGSPAFQDTGVLAYPSLVVPTKLDEYLAHKILWIDGSGYSVREAIKLIANKLGGVHIERSGMLPFDPSDPEVSRSLCAAIVVIAKCTCLATRNVAGLCSPLPPYDECIGHYRIDHGVVDFEEHQWMEVDLGTAPVMSEFSWSAVVEPKPILPNHEILYSLSFDEGQCLRIEMNPRGDITLQTQFGQGDQRYRLKDDGRVRPIGKTVFIQISICQKEKFTEAIIDVHGHRRAFRSDRKPLVLQPARAVIGADQDGSSGAGFRLKELFVTRTVDHMRLLLLRDYFIQRYGFDLSLTP
jgi:hypothetical protein